MNVGKTVKFNLVIDEFQDFFLVNSSIFSGMQDVWDRYKDITRVNFIASGSVFTLMHRIFMNYKEPLYGRCDTIIHLRPFTPSEQKGILSDFYPEYTNDDLLALFTITGGVPKYIELLMDRGAFTVNDMIGRVTENNSIFLEEGKILLVQEFGRKYNGYFSILSAIASGRNTVPKIEQATNCKSLGGMLFRLEEDYGIILKKRPVMSKERSQNVRYYIADNFLRFWFRYINHNQNLWEMGLNDKLRDIILADYATYSGLTLEEWFRQKLKEDGCYKEIGSWWDTTKGNKTDQYEVDVIAIPLDTNSPVLVAEVKRQGKNFKPEIFRKKVEHLRDKIFYDRETESRLFTLEDM